MSPTIQKSEKSCVFVEQYIFALFGRITPKPGNVTDFRAVFPVVSMDNHLLALDQNFKKTVEGFIQIHTPLLSKLKCSFRCCLQEKLHYIGQPRSIAWR